MYATLIYFHSIFRWLVLISLIYAVFSAYKGYFSNSAFSKSDNALRHWTATIAHIQLLIGIILYSQSALIKHFWKNFNTQFLKIEYSFFGLIHIILMLLAIVLITIGSALAKRKETDKEKFKTMLIYFSISLIIILIAIPWPFSPLANRPYLR